MVSGNSQLKQELSEVETASYSLIEYSRAPNFPLPEGFPTDQLSEICSSLANLNVGSIEGCKIPLEYARLKLPAIRRDHILREPDESNGGEPIHSRGTGIDRPLSELIIAVTTALDAYSRVSSQKLDDRVVEEFQIEMSQSPSIIRTIEKSVELSSNLKNASIEATRVFPASNETSERLKRRIHDANNLNFLARAELRGRVVIRWLRKIIGALRLTPGKLRIAAKSLEVTKDAAEIWSSFNSKVFRASMELLEDTSQKFEEQARNLEKRSGSKKMKQCLNSTWMKLSN